MFSLYDPEVEEPQFSFYIPAAPLKKWTSPQVPFPVSEDNFSSSPINEGFFYSSEETSNSVRGLLNKAFPHFTDVPFSYFVTQYEVPQVDDSYTTATVGTYDLGNLHPFGIFSRFQVFFHHLPGYLTQGLDYLFEHNRSLLDGNLDSSGLIYRIEGVTELVRHTYIEILGSDAPLWNVSSDFLYNLSGFPANFRLDQHPSFLHQRVGTLSKARITPMNSRLTVNC